MAEVHRMTVDEVVSYFLEGEGVEVLRDSLRSLCQQLIEAEVSELVGAERGEPATGGAANASQWLPAAAVADARRRDRARDPEAAPRQLLPQLP